MNIARCFRFWGFPVGVQGSGSVLKISVSWGGVLGRSGPGPLFDPLDQPRAYRWSVRGGFEGLGSGFRVCTQVDLAGLHPP